MKQITVIFGIVLTLAGSAVPPSSSVLAAESASYILYDETPNYAQRGPSASEHYLLNEDGLTWVALPVVSPHFQIVSGPPSAISSSSSSNSSAVSLSASSVSSEEHHGGGRGGSGGAGTHAKTPSTGRTSGTLPSHPAAPKPSVPQKPKPSPGTPSVPQVPASPDAKKNLTPVQIRKLPWQKLLSKDPSVRSWPLDLSRASNYHLRQSWSRYRSSLLDDSGDGGVPGDPASLLALLGVLLLLLLLILFQQRRHDRCNRSKKHRKSSHHHKKT